MRPLQLDHVPIARAAMLIRRPVAEVFQAFIDPAVTTKFWFTKSGGKLQAGTEVRWEWEMYNVSTKVAVKAIEENSRIVVEWGDDHPSLVEWKFIPHEGDKTFVSITNSGFEGTAEEIVLQALDSTGGFSLVLAGAKCWLEHNVQLNLVADRFPAGLATH